VALVTVPVQDIYDPAILQYNSAVPASVDNTSDGTINWANVGPLPIGASTSIVATFTALASTPNDVTNRVIASPTVPPDEPPVPPKTNETPYDVSSSGYTVTKTQSTPSAGNSVRVGEQIQFTLTVVNTGDVVLATVPVQVIYNPAILQLNSAVPASVDNLNDGTINWANIGPLPIGASTSIVATFTALASTPNDVTNRVIATPTVPPDEPPVPPKTNETPYDVSSSGFTVAKTQSSPTAGNSVRVGEQIQFTLTVVNTGDVVLVTVPVQDIYNPAILQYNSAIPASVDNLNDGTINWASIGPLPNGASTSIVATFTALASTPNDVTNRVIATPTVPPDEPPVPPKTNETPYDVSAPGYTVTKTLQSPLGRPAVVGEPMVFTLTVVNTGDVELVSVPLQDIYSTAFLTYVSATPASVDNNNDGSINWANVGPLPIGSSVSVTVNYTAAGITSSQARTNVVVASPSTPPDEPPVPPKTNNVPYNIMTLTIGDTVWLDLNGNGNPNDENLAVQGINSVRVDLYNVVSGVTNLVDFRNTATVGPQRGYYVFTNLPFGSYFVQVDVSSLPSAQPTNGPNAGQIITLVPTTPLRYNVVIPTNGIFLTADFGFISSDPTAVDLIDFHAEKSDGIVSLFWETATELNNMGFNLYRSTSPDGDRTRINADMVPGRGTGIGGKYSFTEVSALSDGTYYYWLEDVEYDFSTREHGPVRLTIGEDNNASLVGSATLTVDGIVKISADSLIRSGISPATVNPQQLRVYVDGSEVAAMVTSYGDQFANYDYVLAYVENPDAEEVEISVGYGTEGEPLRMGAQFVFLDGSDGDVWTAAVAPGSDQIRAQLDQFFVRSLVTGFVDSNIWLLDVTDPIQPVLLLGAYLVNVNGQVALYYSDPSSAFRSIYAASASKVTEVWTLTAPAVE